MQHDYDLLIIGGGLAGNCLALALQSSGLRIAIAEAHSRQQLSNSPAGDRALALAAGTVDVLRELNIWQGIDAQATAIKHIHISDRGHFGKTRLSAAKEGVDALGYVITARVIEDHVADLVAASDCTVICPARLVGLMAGDEAINVSLKYGDDSLNLSVKLVVGADGGMSSVRKLLGIAQQITDYGQTALVTTVESALPHNNTAFERFTSSGPLALLPMSKKHNAVVWTRNSEDADALMHGGEADFLAELQSCFGYRLGELRLLEPRRAFPLALIRAESMIDKRAVIIGNAVHQLHPVAGQGFNLGLRDVVALATILNTHATADIGAADVLKNYALTRQRDHDVTIGFTDHVVTFLSTDGLGLAFLRPIGLTVFDHLPTAKHRLARLAMGFKH
jgi:2-octaprenyl-6-methoxyphenol hydroxylase